VAGNYKTFVALLENHVVGFISIVHALAVGSANGYLHITGLAVHHDFQRHRVGTEQLQHTENYAKDSVISTIILCTGMKRTDVGHQIVVSNFLYMVFSSGCTFSFYCLYHMTSQTQ